MLITCEFLLPLLRGRTDSAADEQSDGLQRRDKLPTAHNKVVWVINTLSDLLATELLYCTWWVHMMFSADVTRATLHREVREESQES